MARREGLEEACVQDAIDLHYANEVEVKVRVGLGRLRLSPPRDLVVQPTQRATEDVAALARVRALGVVFKFLQEGRVLAHNVHAIHDGVHEGDRTARIANSLVHEPHARHRAPALGAQPLLPRLDLRVWVEEDDTDARRRHKFQAVVVEADDVGKGPTPEGRGMSASAANYRGAGCTLRSIFMCVVGQRTWKPPSCVRIR